MGKWATPLPNCLNEQGLQMKSHSIAEISLRADQPLSVAVSCIEASGGEIALVTDEAGKLVGTITDGDIRRGILRGATLDTMAADVMYSAPRTTTEAASRSEILALLRKHSLRQMPILTPAGVVVDIVYADDLQHPAIALHPVVIMAGGLGTRLRPVTETVPKPMISVGGRPILETIIEQFQTQGFRSITLCVNHLAQVIEEYFEDGAKFGVEITYVRESTRMGTAGALSLLNFKPTHPLIVMNGDILTSANFGQLLSFHYENMALATMGLNRYQYQLPYGVVDVEHQHIKSFTEKPVYDFFVNAGIYVINPEALQLIPAEKYFDMPSLFENIDNRKRAAFPLHEYWLDIGRHDDLEKANDEYHALFSSKRDEEKK
ncbi:nucleotidyltransferase family protein [Rhizobium sp. S96]|uniref:nucleotidyltransferase family protein n=1 Tax=Rhizobium sp. S96 TaxID=3055140 RepID=UPI0025AAEE5A|nr:nucleotidyltransferase family protein [Rhizobium sp. S96]MDM9620894.1 nucleotidyltransferase family protein [Rhizobium sp. S96]